MDYVKYLYISDDDLKTEREQLHDEGKDTASIESEYDALLARGMTEKG